MNTTPATDTGGVVGAGKVGIGAVDTVIIGAGQSGLALGYYLAQQHRNFVILDAGTRVGDAWRSRWDSLRLFTPAKYNGLPGRPFPGDPLAFPTKDEQADYLEDYASRFHLPVRPNTAVTRLSHDGQRFHVTAGTQRWTAANVVLATGACQLPKTPGFAAELPSDVVQLHSHNYRNPAQLKPGPVLVVGVGNSGAEIALETSRTHETWLAGKPSAEIPFRHGRTAARFFLPVVRFAGMHVLTTNTPVGRKVLPKIAAMATPLIRTKLADLRAAGVHLVPRVTGVRGRRSNARRRPAPSGGKRHLVHRLHRGLPVAGHPGAARELAGAAAPRDRGCPAGPVPAGERAHLRRSIGNPPRRGPGRQIPGEAARRHPGSAARSGGPERAGGITHVRHVFRTQARARPSQQGHHKHC